MTALRLVQNYLSNQKQRTKINTEYSSWEEIWFGVPQGSILGPLLFNIFLSNIFLIINNTELASCADEHAIRCWEQHRRVNSQTTKKVKSTVSIV